MKSLDIKLLEEPIYHSHTEDAPPQDRIFQLHHLLSYHIKNGNPYRLDAILKDESNLKLLFPPSSFKRSYQNSVELISLAKFSSIEGGCGGESAYLLFNTYAEYLLECHTVGELIVTCQNAVCAFARSSHTVSEFVDSDYSPAVISCIHVILDHIPEKLSLEMIAGEVHLSPKYLSALFVRETGRPITDFIHDVRVSEAKHLLAHSDLSYLEISTLLGFSSQSYFNAIFKKKTGLTPKEFRHQSPVEVTM